VKLLIDPVYPRKVHQLSLRELQEPLRCWSVLKAIPQRSILMRQQRTHPTRMAAPASTYRAPTDPPTSGYALIVDGHVKLEFKIQDSAIQAAKDLKQRFPNLQIKVYDAETKRSEKIELAPA
jgi:hypothetical protein